MYSNVVNDRSMYNMTLENITRACGGTYVGNPKHRYEHITGAVIDSRQVEEGFLFIPIKGERVDGHKFIPQVFEQGALAVLTDHPLENPVGPYILVDSTPNALKDIAEFYKESIHIPTIGVIGSVGKTSTKEMIASVLSQKFNVLKTAGNFNNEIGLPLTIFRITKEHEVAVLEMGISDFGEMDRLGRVAKPDIAVITNIGCCHLENLIDRDGILKAKTEVFKHMPLDGVAVLNGDDDKLSTKKSVNDNPSIFYGIEHEGQFGADKDIYATNVVNCGFEGMKATINTPDGAFDVHISIPGEHNVYNALAATAVALKLGLSLAQIKEGIESAKTIDGRTNFIKSGNITIIDDCYNANPVSMKTSIEVLSHATGRSIAVLGDMGELGTDEAALHAEVGTAVGEHNIDTLFCTGELAKHYAKAASKENSSCDVRYFDDRESMTQELLDYIQDGDTILIKASHFMEFPKVVEALKEREEK